MPKKLAQSSYYRNPDTLFFAWRERLGLTQKEAATALGITVTTYQSYEREERLRDGQHQESPLMARLAAAAIEQGISAISKPSPKKQKSKSED